MPRLPPFVGALVGTSLVAARHGHDAAFPLQLASIVLASGVGYVLDDPAFEILAASPTPLRQRRLQRLSVALPPIIVVWVLLLRWQGTAGSEETWALAAMFAGLLGLSLGIAGATARRSSRGGGGFAGAPALLVMLFASTILAPRWRPLPMGDIPGGWPQIYLRWSLAAVIGVLLFLLSSRDPATLAVRRRLPRGVATDHLDRGGQ